MAATRFDVKQLLSDFERAFNTKDYEAALKHYDPNVEFLDPNGKTLRGVETFKKFWEMWGNGFSDTKIEVMQAVQTGNDVALLQRCSARHTGDFEISPGEHVAATNKPVKLVIAEFLRLNDQGKIVSDIGVMDTADLMRQLGVLPSPAQEAASRRTVQR
jgi:ketosteroid isomerase-like protein